MGESQGSERTRSRTVSCYFGFLLSFGMYYTTLFVDGMMFAHSATRVEVGGAVTDSVEPDRKCYM